MTIRLFPAARGDILYSIKSFNIDLYESGDIYNKSVSKLVHTNHRSRSSHPITARYFPLIINNKYQGKITDAVVNVFKKCDDPSFASSL